MIRISHIGIMEEDLITATEKDQHEAFVKQLSV